MYIKVRILLTWISKQSSILFRPG